MDFRQFAYTLLLPAAVSFIVAVLNNRRQKALDFNYDYRKYILDKRKLVYDEVEKILEAIKLRCNNVNEKPVHCIFVQDGNPIIEYNNQIAKCLNKAVWLSDEMIAQMQTLNDTVSKMYQDINSDSRINWRKEVIETELSPVKREFAEKYFDEIKSICMNMYAVFFTDICNLDNTRRFKNKTKYYI